MMPLREPPFGPEDNLVDLEQATVSPQVFNHTLSVSIPHGFHNEVEMFKVLDPRHAPSFRRFITKGIDVTRVNGIQRYSKLAGLPRPTRLVLHRLLQGAW